MPDLLGKRRTSLALYTEGNVLEKEFDALSLKLQKLQQTQAYRKAEAAARQRKSKPLENARDNVLANIDRLLVDSRRTCELPGALIELGTAKHLHQQLGQALAAAEQHTGNALNIDNALIDTTDAMAETVGANVTQTSLKPLSRGWVACLGDSHVSRTRKKSSRDHIPHQLAMQLPPTHAVMTCGSSRAVAASGQPESYVDSEAFKFALRTRAEVILMSLGANDARSGIAPDAFEAGLHRILQMVRDELPGARIYVLQPIGWCSPAKFSIMRASAEKVARLSGAVYVALELEQADFKDDHLHLTLDGAAKVAKHFCHHFLGAMKFDRQGATASLLDPKKAASLVDEKRVVWKKPAATARVGKSGRPAPSNLQPRAKHHRKG